MEKEKQKEDEIYKKLTGMVSLIEKILKKSRKKNSNQYGFYIYPIFWSEQKRVAKAIEDYDGSENKYIYNEYFLNLIYRISNLIKVIDLETFKIINKNDVIKNMLFVRNCIIHPEESYNNGKTTVFDINYNDSYLNDNSYFNSTDISISRDSYINNHGEIEDNSKNSPEKKGYCVQSLHNVVSIKNVKNSFIESIDSINKSLKN